jgi:hypothetical protein
VGVGSKSKLQRSIKVPLSEVVFEDPVMVIEVKFVIDSIVITALPSVCTPSSEIQLVSVGNALN